MILIVQAYQHINCIERIITKMTSWSLVLELIWAIDRLNVAQMDRKMLGMFEIIFVASAPVAQTFIHQCINALLMYCAF